MKIEAFFKTLAAADEHIFEKRLSLHLAEGKDKTLKQCIENSTNQGAC